MTPRERYLATILYQNPDRVPFFPGWGRKSTLEAWHTQGLPAEVHDYLAYIRKQLNLPEEANHYGVGPGVEFRMLPMFEEKVLERRANSQVVQDWKGNICEIGLEFDVTYLRNPVDFVTRNWIKCPVENRKDWADMTRRYNPDDPKRFNPNYAEWCKRYGKDRTLPSQISFSGPFWQLREWLGAENLCMLLIEDPDWCKEMIRFWEDFMYRMLERIFQDHVPDGILFNEDMAYKAHPFISPEMTRQFLMPCWQRWIKLARQAGVKVLEVDSDGYVGDLIPLWIESGVNLNSPQEVAAGNDLIAQHQQYGRKMAYTGGVDKRKMAAGGAAIRAEIDRLRPVIRAGGFIPSCDHGVPADVSWPNFVDYCRLLAQATGWLK